MGDQTTQRPRGGLRPEIQGLRALAVLSVVLFHLWPERLPGGYVGVDVFFVISGFLISGQIYRELSTTGSLRLGAFWVRRGRRLLPAATLVLMTSVVAVVLLIPYSYWQQFLGESIAATLYVENWALASSAVNYLAAENGASLVQHYWSLSVEEQYYFVWPLLLIGLAALARMTRLDRTWTLMIGIGVASLAAFVFCVSQTAADPGVAYFSTLTRAWEFGLGAMLALTAARLDISSRILTCISALGAGMILAAVLFFNEATAFPGVAAIVPTIGTVLVIMAGTPRNWWGRVIQLRPIQFVGAVSYSLYLWHWPPIAVALIVSGGRLSAPLKITIFLSALGAAWLTFRFVEQRFRHRPSERARRFVVVAGAALVGTLVMSALPVLALQSATSTQEKHTEPFENALDLESRILTSSLNPSAPLAASAVLGAGAEPVPEWIRDGCLDVTAESTQRCTYGDKNAPHVAAVIGDSMSASWLPALRGALNPSDWQIKVLTLGQCPVADVSVVRNDGNTSFTAKCNDHRSWVREVLSTADFDLVIVSQSSSAVNYLASGAQGSDAMEEWVSGLEREFTWLENLGTAVVVLARPEFGQRPAAECIGLLLTIEACVGRFPTGSAFPQLERREATSAGIAWVGTRDWLCTPHDECPPVIDGTPVTADGSHLSWAFSQRLSHVVLESLIATDEISGLTSVG